MRNYILSRPKGTFKEATLKGFVKRGYITEDDYKQLSIEPVEQAPATAIDATSLAASEASNEAAQSDNQQSNTPSTSN